MSSILKALRKLEDEKADVGQGSVDLSRDILKRSYEVRRSSSLWIVVALAAAGLLIAAGWWLFSPDTLPQELPPAEPTTQSATTISPSTELKIAPQDKPPVIIPERTAEEPVKQVKRKPVAVEIPLPKLRAPVPPPAPAPAAAPALVIPDLVIEEIVYVADPSARLAVINDLPVMQGTDIEGATVLEIKADRVRFEFKGIQFDKFVAKKTEN